MNDQEKLKYALFKIVLFTGKHGILPLRLLGLAEGFSDRSLARYAMQEMIDDGEFQVNAERRIIVGDIYLQEYRERIENLFH